MIALTRLNGQEFALNCDLVERIEATPDTVITLVDGTKYVIHEGVADVIARIREYRTSILVQADEMISRAAIAKPRLQVVPSSDGE